MSIWAFIAHLRTIDKDLLQARIQNCFQGGGGSEPRILNFNKQNAKRGGLMGVLDKGEVWFQSRSSLL